MRKVSVFVLLLFLSLFLVAQEKPKIKDDLIATTEDGRKVLLKIDGTWRFLPRVIIIDFPANLRPYPDAIKTILARIPVGTELAILETRSTSPGVLTVKWYRVKYANRLGWISEHTCKIIKKKK